MGDLPADSRDVPEPPTVIEGLGVGATANGPRPATKSSLYGIAQYLTTQQGFLVRMADPIDSAL
jgi:hypothetical protein